MFTLNDYGYPVFNVVDCYGNLVQKIVIREDDSNSHLIPIPALDGFNSREDNCYYWVTK